jgi:hypothetical protein
MLFCVVCPAGHTYLEVRLWLRLAEVKSSTGPTVGTVSRTARVSAVRLNLKEAAGKTLARRTGIAYEAVMSDEKAIIFKVQ